MIAAIDVTVVYIQYKKYVAGKPFIETNLTGKVYIVTGCNTGIGSIVLSTTFFSICSPKYDNLLQDLKPQSNLQK